MRDDAPARHSPGRGLLRLALGDASGFRLFGDTSGAFLASLAPLVAFYLVSSCETAARYGIVLGCTAFLAALTSLLAPPVIAHVLCARWDRLHLWALYANLLNWTQMLFMLGLLATLMLAGLVTAAGLPAPVAKALCVLALLIYGIWFQWFTARGALRLTWWQTVKLLTATQLGTLLILMLPLAAGGDFAR